MAVVWPDDDLDQARSYLMEGRLGDFFRESLGWDESDLGDSSFQTVKVDDPLVPSGVLNGHSGVGVPCGPYSVEHFAA